MNAPTTVARARVAGRPGTPWRWSRAARARRGLRADAQRSPTAAPPPRRPAHSALSSQLALLRAPSIRAPRRCTHRQAPRPATPGPRREPAPAASTVRLSRAGRARAIHGAAVHRASPAAAGPRRPRRRAVARLRLVGRARAAASAEVPERGLAGSASPVRRATGRAAASSAHAAVSAAPSRVRAAISATAPSRACRARSAATGRPRAPAGPRSGTPPPARRAQPRAARCAGRGHLCRSAPPAPARAPPDVPPSPCSAASARPADARRPSAARRPPTLPTPRPASARRRRARRPRWRPPRPRPSQPPHVVRAGRAVGQQAGGQRVGAGQGDGQPTRRLAAARWTAVPPPLATA